MDDESSTEDEDEDAPVAQPVAERSQTAPSVAEGEDDGMSDWFKVDPKSTPKIDDESETESEDENDSDNEDVHSAQENAEVEEKQDEDDDWLKVPGTSGSGGNEEHMDVVSDHGSSQRLSAHDVAARMMDPQARILRKSMNKRRWARKIQPWSTTRNSSSSTCKHISHETSLQSGDCISHGKMFLP